MESESSRDSGLNVSFCRAGVDKKKTDISESYQNYSITLNIQDKRTGINLKPVSFFPCR